MQVSVISENTPAGVSLDIATTYSMPQAIASCSVGLISGGLIDRGVQVRPSAYLHSAP